jgi:Uma2 family endonuclease
MSSTTTQLLTADDLFDLPADRRCELVKGELIDMPPPGFKHGTVINEIAFLLNVYVRKLKLGRVLGAETGFRLCRDPDTVRGIDIAFVRANRIPEQENFRHFEGAPDLAVEVLSPSDTVTALEDKIADLLSAGAIMVWVVNPMRKTVVIHRQGQQPRVLESTDSIDGGEVLPGFTESVESFFA